MPEGRRLSYSTPLLVAMGALMVLIAFLAGVEPWMMAIGAAIAIVMFLVERNRT